MDGGHGRPYCVGVRRPMRLATLLARGLLLAVVASVAVVGPLRLVTGAQDVVPGPLRTDPRQRLAAEQAYLGAPDSNSAHAAIALGVAERSRRSTAIGPLAPTPTWMTVGPMDARFQWNGATYAAVDSGRIDTVRVLAGNSDAVYVGASMGGIWKTTNFSAATPAWTAIGDTLPSLAVGAFDISPTDPNTIIVGLGDPFDTISNGGGVVRTTDGGNSWGAPAMLAGATNVRDLRIDPGNANNVLVAADSGLFRSTNGGVSFSAVTLPQLTSPGGVNIAYIGSSAGQSRWLVSAQATTSVTFSGQGDLYLSADSGATFQSLRTSGGLLSSLKVGRMAIGASSASDPTTNTVYAAAANTNTIEAMKKWRDSCERMRIILIQESKGQASVVSVRWATRSIRRSSTRSR